MSDMSLAKKVYGLNDWNVCNNLNRMVQIVQSVQVVQAVVKHIPQSVA